MALPKPRPPPVTRAVRPSSLNRSAIVATIRLEYSSARVRLIQRVEAIPDRDVDGDTLARTALATEPLRIAGDAYRVETDRRRDRARSAFEIVGSLLDVSDWIQQIGAHEQVRHPLMPHDVRAMRGIREGIRT